MNNRLAADRHYQEFLHWLSPSGNEARQLDLMDKRQEGTGQWFLNSPKFLAWVEGPTRTLLCPGIPGAGKTFMTAIVVNHLRETFSDSDDIGVAVFYCSYKRREEQTKEMLLAGLLRQLVKQWHYESKLTQDLYEKCIKAGRRLSFSELSDVLQSVVSTYFKTMLVVDALDEYEGVEFSQSISELQLLQTVLLNLRVMVTFRPHVPVTKENSHAATLEIRADSWDLDLYIKGQMSRLSKHVHTTTGLRELIIQGIIKAADGMFVLIPSLFSDKSNPFIQVPPRKTPS